MSLPLKMGKLRGWEGKGGGLVPLFSEWRVRLSVLPYLNVHPKLPQKKNH